MLQARIICLSRGIGKGRGCAFFVREAKDENHNKAKTPTSNLQQTNIMGELSDSTSFNRVPTLLYWFAALASQL
jgi:hypothetical protein